MDHGEILALDTPRGLIAGLDLRPVISGSTARPLPLARIEALAGVVDARLDDEGFEIHTDDPQETLGGLLRIATELGLELSNLQVRGGNLEDVFIHLTGRKLRA